MAAALCAEPCFDAFAEYLRARTGLTFPAARRREFENSVREAAADAGVSDPDQLVAVLECDARALDALIAKVTVGETYFFREPTQFEVLRRQILPELCRERGAETGLRLWSAGCASGEEPYSMAILLEEEGLAQGACVLGTDISRAALARARAADYSAWSFRGDENGLAERYFHRRGDRWLLEERIRRRIEFKHLNLASDTYPSRATGTEPCDVIFCRNVLIYFDPHTIEQVARRLFSALGPGGWLITAPSDPLLWNYAPYETVTTAAGVFYRRSNARVAPRLRPGALISARDLVPQMGANAVVPATELAPPAASACPITATTIVPLPSLTVPPFPAAETAVLDPLAEAHGALAAGDFECVLRLTDDAARTPQTCALRIRAHANLGNSHAAETEAAAATRTHPLSAELHYMHAIILLSRARLDATVAALRRVIYLDCSLAVAHFTLASVLRRRGADADACRSYRTALALCAKLGQDEIMPLSDGERARHLAQAARVQLEAIEAATARESAP
jgi:chemotaxis protein methyltransferase CheR